MRLRGVEKAVLSFAQKKGEGQVDKRLVLQTISAMTYSLLRHRRFAAQENAPREVFENQPTKPPVLSTTSELFEEMSKDILMCAAALKYALNLYANEKKRGEK